MTEPRKIAIVAVVLLAVGLLALVIEWLREKVNGWIVLIVVSVVLLVMALSIHHAGARDDGRYAASPLKQWFDSLKSGKGPCCSDADGSAVSDVDWDSKNGRYRVRLEGQWWDVPDDAVITEPNRVGRTMVWPIIYRDEVARTVRIDIRCFMPGSMS